MRIALLAVLAAASFTVAAQDSAPRNLAAACAICHGTDGRAVTRDVNPLAGLAKDQFIARMTAFRNGTRPATVMHQISKGYTDQQIEQLAAYFTAQR